MWMWQLDHKEGWVPKNWCFQTVVLEKTLENHLDSKEIKSVNPEGNQPWMFIGKTDAVAEAPILWPPDVKIRLTGKDPDARKKNWGQAVKRVVEEEMVGWQHGLNGCEFEQTLGDSELQGSLACCGLWGCKESDTTEWLNNREGAPYLDTSIFNLPKEPVCGPGHNQETDLSDWEAAAGATISWISTPLLQVAPGTWMPQTPAHSPIKPAPNSRLM